MFAFSLLRIPKIVRIFAAPKKWFVFVSFLLGLLSFSMITRLYTKVYIFCYQRPSSTITRIFTQKHRSVREK